MKTLTTVLLLGLLILGAVALIRRQETDSWRVHGGHTRIVVAPFEQGPTSVGWPRNEFAESLAARLRQTSGLDARAHGGAVAQADYVLEGDITEDSDRVVIAIRLRPPAQRSATWSATFWRHDLTDATLVEDLTRSVVDALGRTARRKGP